MKPPLNNCHTFSVNVQTMWTHPRIMVIFFSVNVQCGLTLEQLPFIQCQCANNVNSSLKIDIFSVSMCQQRGLTLEQWPFFQCQCANKVDSPLNDGHLFSVNVPTMWTHPWTMAIFSVSMCQQSGLTLEQWPFFQCQCAHKVDSPLNNGHFFSANVPTKWTHPWTMAIFSVSTCRKRFHSPSWFSKGGVEMPHCSSGSGSRSS